MREISWALVRPGLAVPRVGPERLSLPGARATDLEDALDDSEEVVRRDGAGDFLAFEASGLSFATVRSVLNLLTGIGAPTGPHPDRYASARVCAHCSLAASRASRLVPLSCILRALSRARALKIIRRGVEVASPAGERPSVVLIFPSW